MRLSLLCTISLLACVLPAQRTTDAKTLLLLVEGDAQRVSVTAAWRRDARFTAARDHGGPVAWIKLLDTDGQVFERVRLDLATFHLDAKNTNPVVFGDQVREPGIVRLVKIPDSLRTASLAIVRVIDGVERRVATVSRQQLDRAVTTTAAAQPTGAPVVKTHLSNGPTANRYDIVILADGYIAVDQARFYSDVTGWMNNLFGKEPFKSYKKFFNVHSVFNASNQRGADNPRLSPPKFVDTVYDAAYWTGGTERCLYIKNTSQAHRDAAFAPDVEGRIVVFVNDPKYGGCAGTFSVSYNGSSANEVQSHEFGHSFGGLADEYDYGRSGTYTGPEPSNANATADSTCAKWSLWKGYNGVGCFEGCRYYKKGLWRPKTNCLMRALGIQLCEICVEELTKDCYTNVNPIESPQPAASLVRVERGKPQVFSFSNLVPGSVRVRWLVDNQVKQTGGTSFTLQTTAMALGRHAVLVEVSDLSALVRKDKQKLVHTHTWTVDIIDPAPDLVITAISTPSGMAWQAGAQQSVTITTRNASSIAAPASVTTIHLGLSSTVSRKSYLLWFYDVPALGGGQSDTQTVKIQMPWCWMDGGTWYLGAFADGYAGVVEANENNNGRAVTPPRPRARYTGAGRHIEFMIPRAGATDGAYHHGRATWEARNGVAELLCITAPRYPLHWVVTIMSASDKAFAYDIWSQLSISAPLFWPVLGKTSGGGRLDPVLFVPGFVSSATLTSYTWTLWMTPSSQFIGFGDNTLQNELRK